MIDYWFISNKVKVGDIVNRLLAGSVDMPVKVTDVDDRFIYCCPPGMNWTGDDRWKFLRSNGGEVDKDLGWDGIRTGSRLTGRAHLN
jgi:hypothetical protein